MSVDVPWPQKYLSIVAFVIILLVYIVVMLKRLLTLLSAIIVGYLRKHVTIILMGYAAHIGDMLNTCRIFFGKPAEKTLFGRPDHK
jgi:hypothetical protein